MTDKPTESPPAEDDRRETTILQDNLSLTFETRGDDTFTVCALDVAKSLSCGVITNDTTDGEPFVALSSSAGAARYSLSYYDGVPHLAFHDGRGVVQQIVDLHLLWKSLSAKTESKS